MITTSESNTLNKANTSLYVSIWIFVFVLLLTVWLYIYNWFLLNQTQKIESEVSKIEENTKNISNDEKVKLYTLVMANSVFLEKYKYLSNIPEYISNLVSLSRKYNVSFDEFSYSDWVLSTNVVALSDAVSLASDKTNNFVWYFRKNDDNIFSLWFVDSFVWQTDIKFSVKFKIK